VAPVELVVQLLGCLVVYVCERYVRVLVHFLVGARNAVGKALAVEVIYIGVNGGHEVRGVEVAVGAGSEGTASWAA